MIGTIRKHQQWLWAIIIVATIISFVWFFSPDAKVKGLWTKPENRLMINSRPVTINGQPITLDQYRQALQETRLMYFMRSGGREWPTDETALQRDAIYRVFLEKKLAELDIHISDLAVAQAAKDRLGPIPLATFQSEYLAPQRLSLDDFERFLRHELGIQQLITVAGVSGKLFSPAEGEAMFRKEHEQSETEVALFWRSNYLDKVVVTPEDLAHYYTNNMAQYRLPERVIVKYVTFSATNFLAEADKQMEQMTNFNALVDEYYYKRGTNYFRGTNGAVLPEAEAKKQIKDDMREQFALKEAHRKASEFGSALYSQPEPDKAENLDKLAAAEKLPVQVSPPLRRDAMDEAELEFSQDFRDAAFKLGKDVPFGDFRPIRTEEAVYVIALKEKLPSEAQPLDKVKDKVTADFKSSKALELARNAGAAFYNSVTNGLAQKKSFDQLCKDSNVNSVTLPPFSPSSTSLTNLDERLNLQMLQRVSTDLKPGQVSHYISTPPMSPEGGFVLYLKGRKPVDDAVVREDLPEFMGRLRAYRQSEAFNQWFRKQAELSKLFIPPSRESTGIAGS